MGIAQTPEAGQDVDAPPDVLFLPPKGDVCYINNLPPELLSRIFEIGSADEDTEDENDIWVDLHRSHTYKINSSGKNTPDSDTETTEELEDEDGEEEEESDEEEEEEEEEGTSDEDNSDASGQSLYLLPCIEFKVIASHVCRHWRRVAFATPSLWTTIDVDPDDRPPYEFVSTLLERSKGLPIDIRVTCDPPEPESSGETDSGPPSDADLSFLYSLLVSHIHRWRTIEVSVSEYHHMYVFLCAVSDPSISSAPQLTTLELYYHEDMDEFDNFGYSSMSKHLTLFGGFAPCLTKVVLWGVHVDWNQPWIASASKLKTLELSYHPEDVRPTWAQLASILRGASALERLCLRMSAPLGDPPEWFIEPTPESPYDLNGPIQLLKVNQLDLAFQSPARAIGIIHKLCLPALKNLLLDFDDGDYTEFVHQLVGPVTSLPSDPVQEQPSSLLGRLENVKIGGLPCRDECVEMLYGELQNLKALNISLSYLPELFLDILSAPCASTGRSGFFLPRLVTLFVSGTSSDAVREVVERRRDAGVPLESLYLEESCEMNKGDVKWLKENLKTFDLFYESDDEDVDDFDDMHEDVDVWSDME